jgi:hypothetical protein
MTTMRDTHDEPVYDFEHLSEKLADTMMRAAEDQVNEAQNIYEHTKMVAEHIRAQAAEQSAALADINGRLKSFGASLLEAHRKFTNVQKPAVDTDEHKVLNLHDRQTTANS